MEASYTSNEKDVLEIFNPTAASAEIFAKALAIAQEGRAGKRDKEEALEAIKALLPDLAPFIDLWKGNDRWSYVVIFAMIIWLIQSCTSVGQQGTVVNNYITNEIHIQDGREYRELEKPSKRKLRRLKNKPRSGATKSNMDETP